MRIIECKKHPMNSVIAGSWGRHQGTALHGPYCQSVKICSYPAVGRIFVACAEIWNFLWCLKHLGPTKSMIVNSCQVGLRKTTLLDPIPISSIPVIFRTDSISCRQWKVQDNIHWGLDPNKTKASAFRPGIQGLSPGSALCWLFLPSFPHGSST